MSAAAAERVDDDFFLWPENATTWREFLELQGQWRTSMAGPYALDFTAVLGHLRERYPRRAARLPIYEGVLVCHSAVLKVWNERRKRERAAGG